MLIQAVALPLGPTPHFGVGTVSCAAAMQGSVAERAGWILGFWAGVDEATGRMVGNSTDAKGIVGEVERRCALQPATHLSQVILEAYQEMARTGR